MVRERNRLPGSRGAYSGPDAFVAETESQFARARLTSKEYRELWLLKEFHPWGDLRNAGTFTAATLQLIPLLPLRDSYRLHYGRVRVTFAAAGEVARLCLYQYQGRNTLQKVSASEFVVSTTTAALINQPLPTELILPAGDNYFAALWVQTATPQFTRLTAAVAPLSVASYSIALPTVSPGGLPTTLDLTGFTKVFTGSASIEVAYLSNRAVVYL